MCLYFNIRFHFSTKYALKRVPVNFCKTYLDLTLFEAHSVLLIYASKRFKTLKWMFIKFAKLILFFPMFYNLNFFILVISVMNAWPIPWSPFEWSLNNAWRLYSRLILQHHSPHQPQQPQNQLQPQLLKLTSLLWTWPAPTA